MLFPDETYEDYHKRIKSTNPPSHARKSTTNSSCLTLEGKRSNKSRKNSSNSTLSGKEPGSAGSTSNSGSFKRTQEFFENIPELEEENRTNYAATHSGREPAQRRLKQNNNRLHENHLSTESTDLSKNPIFLRNCETIIQRYRMRPDFFCQYYKAISASTSATSSSKQSASRSRNRRKESKSPALEDRSKSAEKPPNIDKSSASKEVVQRFAQRSAIYTLPLVKRKSENTDTVAKGAKTVSSFNRFRIPQDLEDFRLKDAHLIAYMVP
uniref:Uncharacterized protein n=1 Tax=Stomoxys calcitrans TaxID=35570 RepID=A0A1I8Q2X5_STOCA